MLAMSQRVALACPTHGEPAIRVGIKGEHVMRPMLRSILLSTIATTASVDAFAIDAADTAAVPVVVVVKIAKPWYIPKALIARKMRQALPQYQRLPGLTYKIFSIARPGGEFGGIYFWKDQASARAWFNAAWYRRIKEQRGVDADVRMFESPVMFDNIRDQSDASIAKTVPHAVVTLVTLPISTSTSRMQRMQRVQRLAADMRAERNADGLLREYAILSDAERIGSAYLWRDEASARRWFDAGWQRRMRDLHGADAQIEWFDAPVLMRSALPDNLKADLDAERAMPSSLDGAGQ